VRLQLLSAMAAIARRGTRCDAVRDESDVLVNSAAVLDPLDALLELHADRLGNLLLLLV
jgi:hypothetical protein